MYFTDVVEALAPAKLDYACTATPLDFVPPIDLTPECVAFLSTIEQPILREQVRDYFVSQQFRRDLFLRGAVRLSPGLRQQRLLATRFVLTSPVDAVPFSVRGAAGEAKLHEDVYRPVLDALAEGNHAPKSLGDLVARLPRLGFNQVLQAVTVLTGMGVAGPCQSEQAAAQAAERCALLNAHLCERAQFNGEIDSLASPVVGGGVAVGRVDQLFLRARHLGKESPTEWAQYAWIALSAGGERLMKDGKPIDKAEDNLRELEQRAAALHDERLPILRSLMVID